MATLTDLLTERIPPHEFDAERAVLGAVLWGQPGAHEKAQRRLEPGDFYIERHRILWEATWSRIAPKDPALLKDIGGGLYVVLAIWDLTELERSVLGVRA